MLLSRLRSYPSQTRLQSHSNQSATRATVSSTNSFRVEPGAALSHEHDPADITKSLNSFRDTRRITDRKYVGAGMQTPEKGASKKVQGHRAALIRQRLEEQAQAFLKPDTNSCAAKAPLIPILIGKRGHATDIFEEESIELHFHKSDAFSAYALPPGAETVVRLVAGVANTRVGVVGDALELSFEHGSIRFDNLSNAGAIGVIRTDETRIRLLHIPLSLDRSI